MYTRKWTPYRILIFLLLVSLSACTVQTEVLTPEPSANAGLQTSDQPFPNASVPSTPTQAPSWNVYTNSKYGYSVAYPVIYNVVPVSDEYVEIGDKIVITVSNVDPTTSQGDGPVIESITDVQLSAYPAKLLTGYIGSVGGYLPQQYKGYVFKRNDDYLVLTLYALGLHVTEGDVSQIAQLNPEDITWFDNMIPSLQFPSSEPSAQPQLPVTSPELANIPILASNATQLLAYIRDGKLMITEITNGTPGRTKEYELAGIDNSYPVVPIWSPSGAHLVLSAQVNQELHTFYLWDLESGVPVDMGPSSHPAWSPDGQSIAYIGGQYPDNNLWSTTLPNLSPRPLTSEKNFVWGSMAFTPDGQALVAVGQSHDLAGATGNFPSYAPEYIALDGSGARSRFLSDVIPDFGGSHLPENLQFSSNGKWLAFSTFSHMSASCASGKYYAITADGSTVQELRSSSLENVVGENSSLAILPGNYAWSPASESLAISSGGVIDCDTGERIASQQLSIIGLDGNERLVLPGQFGSPSYDCSGAFLAVTHSQNLQDMNPTIEIYSVQTGQMVLSLGPGMSPSFQPSPSCVILR
jgi:hypothetical protein